MFSDNIEEDIDGIVQSIQVKNFFCHDNFYIDFTRENKNVHYIFGLNGSGKSAILTALVVGLGGRASATSRGSNLQSFIKKNTNTATIEIKIKNSSSRAYKHDIYGDSITIVRTINASGGSYKFKNHAGEVVSTKGSDINAITMAHDIQVDNPISVLNQDDARTLHKEDSKKKYNIFRRATNFDQTEAYYDKALENCKKANDIWKRKNEAFETLSKERKRIEILYKQLQPKEEIEIQKKELEDEIKWCEIRQLENEATDLQKNCEKQRSKCQNVADRLKSMEETYGSDNSGLESLKRQAEELVAPRDELERALRAAEERARGAAGSALAARRDHAQVAARRTREHAKAADLQREIRIIESGENDGGARRVELERVSREARAAADETRARRDTAQHQEEQAREHAARAAAEREAARAALRSEETQIESMRRGLRELRERSSDSLAVFGAPVVELCARVRRDVQAGRFSAPPRGPVGSFLKVKDKRWIGALEHLLDGCMFNFCVNEPRDSKRLFELMAEVWQNRRGRKPAVTCSAFRPTVHDVRARRAGAPGATCALDALEVADPVVANYLIDNYDLETVLLVPTHDEAVRLTDSVQNVPANCGKVVTLDCTEYLPAPRYRIYGGRPREPRFLSTSIGDRTRQIEEDVAERTRAVASKKATETRLADEEAAARSLLLRAAQELHALQSALRQCERAARDAADALQQHAAPQRAVLEEEYEICTKRAAQLDEETEKLEEKRRHCEEESKEAETSVRQVKEKLDPVTREYRGLKEAIDRKQLELERGKNERANLVKRVSEEEDKLKRAEESLAQRRAGLDARQAGLGPRPPRLRLKAELQSELRLIEQKLNAMSVSPLSREQVREQLASITQKTRTVETELQTLKKLIAEIEKITKNHKKMCYDLQVNIGRRVQISFISMLKERGLQGGCLLMDHGERELKVAVRGKSSSSLSGGESSYFTVALIMALWECVEMPFYVLDEFDVCMDLVNRRAAWDRLVSFAARRFGRQFMFISPHALPIESKDLVLHGLDPPRE